MSARTGSTDSMGTLRRGLQLSPELRRGLAGTLALAVGSTAGRLVVPVAIQQIIDTGLFAPSGVDTGRVIQLVLGALVVVALAAVCSSFMAVRLAVVTETALSSLRVRTFRHIHDLSTLHLAEQHRGALVSRVTADIDQISQFMQWAGVSLIVNAAQLVLATVVMAFYSVPLTLVVLGVFLPLVFLLRRFQRRLASKYDLVRERVGRMLAVISESVVGAEVVRAYGLGQRTEHRMGQAVERHFEASYSAAKISVLMSSAGELFAGFATAAVLAVGVWLGLAGRLAGAGEPWLGSLIAFLFLINLFVAPAHLAVEVLDQAQAAIAGWRRVLGLLDTPPDVADPGAAGAPLPEGPLEVEVDHVSFRYPRQVVHRDTSAASHGRAGAAAVTLVLREDEQGAWALRDVDARIAAGSRIAVVGETGSGKTTFAKLLVRLMDPTAGEIRIGGVPTSRIRFADYRGRVVTVPQDGFLFDMSVADNVRQGRPSLSDDEVRSVFAELGLANWLSTLTRSVQTMVGERGGALSSGERQLVALARAYVANPDLLVLDEATSAVDPATEVRIQQALDRVAEGRTSITIAHRLSTAETADEILVFDRGRLAQRGRHAELVDAEGPYARLHAGWTRKLDAA